ASSYTYAEATWKRDLPAWIGSHVRTVEFFQGVAGVTVPDNWKTAVTDPCYYDPDINPDLPGLGGSLRDCRDSRSRAEAPRQGEGRSWRARGRALDTGGPAEAYVL